MRQGSLTRRFFDLAGGQSGIKEYAVPWVDTTLEYDEAVQVTLGKRLAVHLVQVYWRSASDNDDVFIFFDTRDSEDSAEPNNSGVIPICRNLYPNTYQTGLEMRFPVPVIGAVNQSIYVAGQEDTASFIPRVFIWYSEVG